MEDYLPLSFTTEDIENLLSSAAFADGAPLDTFELSTFPPAASEDSTVLPSVPTEGLFPDFSDEFNLQNGSHDDLDLSNLDFNEFWESMKPLMSLNGAEAFESDPGLNQTEGTDPFSPQSGDELGINAAKLAEDLQSLYSGCVL